ncbi:MAG TPA: integrin alpha, partial [Actinomycetota bacterium]|nr:integrin alpha [Actinomycetota bacterium]
TTAVDLSAFDVGAGRGFLITNHCRECVFGFAGDVNGDGVPDVAVGGVAWRRYEAPGSAYVVFGKSDPLPVDTSERTPQSLKIKADSPGGIWGGAVSAAGDVNGDGLGDVVVGIPKSYSCCHGKAAVVFGKTDTRTVRLDDLGSGGFQIEASEERDFFGDDAAGIGDVNGDGLDDIAVGAPGHDYPDRGGPGAVFVIYGKKSRSTLRTGELGEAGFMIVGRESVDWTGTYLGVPRDVNGDGVPDLMISAPSGGNSYLLWL